MGSVLFELRCALRSHLQRPGLVVTVVLCLALGTAAVTVVFQLLYQAILRPLPFPQAERIVEVTMSQPQEGTSEGRASFADFRDWAADSRSFTSLAAVSEESLVLTGTGSAERIPGARVTDEFFAVFALEPVLGSVPREQWGLPGARLVVLAEHLWRQRLGGDRGVLGSTLYLDELPFTVVAVMPAALDFPRETALWLPLDPADPGTAAGVRSARFLRVVGRLSEGATLAAANRELDGVSSALAELFPESNAGQVPVLLSLRERLFGDLRPGLLLLSVAVSCVLLIVCSNVAAVLLARGAARSGDFRVRFAHGATRRWLGLSLMIENLLLTLAGAGLGLVLGVNLGPLLVALSPRELEVALGTDLRLVLVLLALGLAAVAGLFVTFPCAVQAARHGRVISAGRGTVGSDRFTTRIQSLLLTVQLAVTVALLVGSGSMVRSTLRLLSVEPGFRTEGLVTARVLLPATRYPEPFHKAAFMNELLEQLEGRPGILSVAAVTNLPLSGSNMTFGVSSVGDGQADASFRAHYRAVSPRYFHTLGAPVVEGREIGAGDVAAAPPVAIVNRAFARAFFPSGRAVGREIRLTYGDKLPRRVVGVVGDLRHFELGRAAEPEVYVPFAQQPWPFMTLVVHGDREPPQLIAAVRAAVAAVDPSLPADRFASMEELVAASVARPRFYGALLGTFALLALLTAGVGVYGLTSFWVNLRRDEIGIRMALGAAPPTIRHDLLRRPLLLGLIGLAAGSGLALLVGRGFESLFYGVAPDDPATLAATGAILLLAVLLAAWLPARRASRVNPALVLRND